MATCSNCNKTILFGGTKNDGRRYCNQKCERENTEQRALLASVSDEEAWALAQDVRNRPCPVCKHDRGPVDVRSAHRCVSLIIKTEWETTQRLSCRRCGIIDNFTNSVLTLLMGWWGIPFGIFITPVQLLKNVGEVMRGDLDEPSDELVFHARIERGLQLQAQLPSPLTLPLTGSERPQPYAG